ncbi:MAG: hypothetical protein ACKV2O_08565 [Acidimicrobiales bacterium]
MSARRHVVVLPEFFDRLDDLLPAERAADGTPSTADFVLHELTSIVETLAEDYEGVTTPIPGRQTRVLITSGMLIRSIAIYVELTPTGAVELFWLDIDR